MTGVAADLADAVRRWIERDPDPETRAELSALLAAGDGAALAERFAGRLEFGTAGLRGPMAAGPTRMNRAVVRESAAGVARYLLAEVAGAAARGVVVSRDARRRSDRFAADCAEVLAAHGLRVAIADEPWPTPLGVFAIRHVGAAAGIVVTASHNPAADSGIKLYMGDGAQIIPPVDSAVAAAIDAVAADGMVMPATIAHGPQEALGADVREAYLRCTLARVPPPAAPIAIATTAMHGVGGALLRRLLAEAGHQDVRAVAAQEAPDPAFPTVALPNPEEPGATDLLADLMRAEGSDLGLALDPDADRLAVLVPDPAARNVPRQLTGDDLGALLGEWLLAEVTAGPGRLVVSSVVSSTLLAKVAAAHGARHAETLTGFKWLARPALEHPEWHQVLAYEEALGYAVGADARDKDGLSAALAVAAMAAAERARGRTLLDALDDLHRRHGAHVNANFSLRDPSLGARPGRERALVALMGAERLGSERVRGVERLAPDVLRLELGEGLRAVVRPSGTEPKLKCYCEAIEPAPDGDVAAARGRAQARLDPLRDALIELLRA